MENHRWNERAAHQDERRHDGTRDRRLHDPGPSLIDVADAEDQDSQRHRAGRAEPRCKEPREIAAVEQLLTEARCGGHDEEPRELAARPRQHEAKCAELRPGGDASLGRESQHRPELQRHQTEPGQPDR